jgi:hypothetical protein
MVAGCSRISKHIRSPPIVPRLSQIETRQAQHAEKEFIVALSAAPSVVLSGAVNIALCAFVCNDDPRHAQRKIRRTDISKMYHSLRPGAHTHCGTSHNAHRLLVDRKQHSVRIGLHRSLDVPEHWKTCQVTSDRWCPASV